MVSARRVTTPPAPLAVLRPVGIRVHVSDLRGQRGVRPVNLAAPGRTGIKPNWIGKSLPRAAWHAAVI